MIYLDNAATTRVDNVVFDAMVPWLTDSFGNAGAKYELGRSAAQAVYESRCDVAKLFGCNLDNVVFTSGGSEANSLAIYNAYKLWFDGDILHIPEYNAVVYEGEHHSTLSAFDFLFNNEVQYVDRKFGESDEEFIKKITRSIDHRTKFISVMYVNNETGVVNPVKEIGRLCKENGIVFHTDCVQAAGSRPINVEEIGCDFASISGHKIHAPKGIGALYVKDINSALPIIYGSESQEFGVRGGTENVASIVGLGVAAKAIFEKQADTSLANHEKLVKSKFYSELMSNLEKFGLNGIVHVNGLNPDEQGKILSLRFDGVDAETLLLLLDTMGVCASAGSACNSHDSEPSRVLVSCGLTPDEARSSVRFSFSKNNTEEEAIEAAKIVADCVELLYRI